jgi:hypothetical protein
MVNQGDYLRRSAENIRATVMPPLSKTSNEVDRFIRLVFTADGPQYWNAETEAEPASQNPHDRRTCKPATPDQKHLKFKWKSSPPLHPGVRQGAQSYDVDRPS